MNDEKKTDAVSSETGTADNRTEEKKQEEQPAVKPETKQSETEEKETAEDQKTETLNTETGKNQSQAEENGTSGTPQPKAGGKESTTASSQPQTERKTDQNDAGGNVPPVNKAPAPERKHHGIWKKVLMYVLVFLVAGCGAFAGSYMAQRVYHAQMEKEAVKQFGNFGNMMPFGGDNSESTTSGPALGITIQQTDDGIEIVGFASNGNAEKAGLKTGDIIREVDGKSYDSVSAISSYISSKNVGDKVKVTVSRNGEEKTYSVRLVKKDVSSYSMPSAPSDRDSDSDDQNQPKALPGTDGENSQLQG